MNSMNRCRLFCVLVSFGFVLSGGCAPPITEVIDESAGDPVGRFVPEPLPTSTAPEGTPAISAPTILAWEDQGFFVDTEQVGDLAVTQVALALDGYSGHIVVDVAPEECGQDIEFRFRVRVTSGEFNLRMVPISEDGGVGDVVDGVFEVELCGFTRAQRDAVELVDDAVLLDLVGAGAVGQAFSILLEMDFQDSCEKLLPGCPSVTGSRDCPDGDLVTLLWEFGEQGTGCVDDRFGFTVTGRIDGTGSLAE